MYIALDKSYLQRYANKNNLLELSERNRILLTDVLMYEIASTSDRTKSKSCYNILLKIKNKVDFLPNIGTLLRYEFLNKKAVTLKNILYPKSLYPNFFIAIQEVVKPSLTNFKITNEYDKIYYKHFEIDAVDYLIKIGSTVIKILPEITEMNIKDKNQYINNLMKQYGKDNSKVIDFYKKFSETISNFFNFNIFPSHNLINQDWVIFRYFQVSIISWLEYYRKYGDKQIRTKDMVNTCLDIELCISSLLAGSIATCDNGIKEIFNLCLPNGLIFD